MSAGVEVGYHQVRSPGKDLHVHRPEGDESHGDGRGHPEDVRGDLEHGLVGRVRRDVLFAQKLGQIAEGLQDPARSGVVGSHPTLHEAGELALAADEHGSQAHTEEEDDGRLDDKEDEVVSSVTAPQTTSTLPKMPTMSASISPSNMAGMAWQW